MGPPSSHLQHPAAPVGLEETGGGAGGGWLSPAAQPAQTGSAAAADRAGNIIPTLMAPSSPWELLGGLSPAEIFPRSAEKTGGSRPAALAPPAPYY